MIPAISAIITYDRYSPIETIAANIYFISISFFIWMGCNWIHNKLRSNYKIGDNPLSKIATLCFICVLYGVGIGDLLSLLWFYFSREFFHWSSIYKFSIVYALAIVLFTLVYEILFLSKERELDSKLVYQLDRERSQAELEALKNELDPHFIFNSLNTLNHLILNNPSQAHLFNNKLAQVYKYFLINKTNELISLYDELEFINNYFFLLQIRHDDKLNLEMELKGGNERLIMIPPFALQILVENAIKHNEFNQENPLLIKIAMNGHFLKVSNNIKPKAYPESSTGIGLKNLSSRYKILCNRNIIIENTDKNFSVKLPLIKQT